MPSNAKKRQSYKIVAGTLEDGVFWPFANKANEIRADTFAVYENGNLCEFYDTRAEAETVVNEMRRGDY
jgi:hypothetical protein